MRIAVATWSSRQVGGAETYIARSVASFAAAGHDVAICVETDEPDDRPRFVVPAGVEIMSAAEPGGSILERLHRWAPDVVYVHGLSDPDFEARVLAIAPAVLFAHGYYGTCISGSKTHRFPVIQPCSRTFGAACLGRYYPRRCGGLNPITLARDYARQRHRRVLLDRYAAVLTLSEHMRREYVRNGIPADRVINCSVTAEGGRRAPLLHAQQAPADRVRVPHLVFAGRMDPLKGGEQLIRAAALAHTQLETALRITLAGDGPERVRWERIARDLGSRFDAVSIHFTGWLGPAGVARLLATADILVMPSLWPEPFGLIGQEANRQGVPVVAYATGGIPEWLTEGVNGCLAPGDPPTVEGLAAALVRCLSDRPRHRAMRRAAVEAGYSRPDDLHAAAVLEVLGRVAGQARSPQVLTFARSR
jgi:glycosyltransferase involved in cell wall biosynthesis